MADLARPGRINPGRLDRRIIIQRMSGPVDDGMREKPGDWFEVSTRFAGLEPLSGAERVAAAQNTAFRTLKFRIRRPRGFTVDPKLNRLLYHGQPYDVTDVQEIGREWMDLIGTTRADSTPA